MFCPLTLSPYTWGELLSKPRVPFLLNRCLQGPCKRPSFLAIVNYMSTVSQALCNLEQRGGCSSSLSLFFFFLLPEEAALAQNPKKVKPPSGDNAAEVGGEGGSGVWESKRYLVRCVEGGRVPVERFSTEGLSLPAQLNPTAAKHSHGAAMQ